MQVSWERGKSVATCNTDQKANTPIVSLLFCLVFSAFSLSFMGLKMKLMNPDSVARHNTAPYTLEMAANYCLSLTGMEWVAQCVCVCVFAPACMGVFVCIHFSFPSSVCLFSLRSRCWSVLQVSGSAQRDRSSGTDCHGHSSTLRPPSILPLFLPLMRPLFPVPEDCCHVLWH